MHRVYHIDAGVYRAKPPSDEGIRAFERKNRIGEKRIRDEGLSKRRHSA
jgi:hypothetical protein